MCAGCAAGGHYQVEADEFLARTRIESVRSHRLIGVCDGRVYLEVHNVMPHSFGGGAHVYSAELAGLPKDIRDALLAGRDPFAPPLSR